MPPLYGASTRAVHAGLPEARQGQPLGPNPVLAAPLHLAGEADPSSYGRYDNPTWAALETALGQLEGGETLVFGSGMAAMSACLIPLLRPGDVLVAVTDGYPGIRELMARDLEPSGVVVRRVVSETDAVLAQVDGARLVWVESPANPRLEVLDLPRIAAATRAAGALLAVDNTVCTALGQQPLALGADLSMCSGTKSLAGHSDLLLGTVATQDAELAATLRAWRGRGGAIPSPFEAWLAHRSLATLELRLARQSANARALADLLDGRDDVLEVLHPSRSPHLAQMRHTGCLVSFSLRSASAAQDFLSRCSLVAEATSFGGVHTTAERRLRWCTDDVHEGFVRFSCGIEDGDDLMADVLQALDAAA